MNSKDSVVLCSRKGWGWSLGPVRCNGPAKHFLLSWKPQGLEVKQTSQTPSPDHSKTPLYILVEVIDLCSVVLPEKWSALWRKLTLEEIFQYLITKCLVFNKKLKNVDDQNSRENQTVGRDYSDIVLLDIFKWLWLIYVRI